MDFNETLHKMQEAVILPTSTLKNKSASGAVDDAIAKKNAELKKQGKQIKVDKVTGRAEVTRIDKNTSNAIDAINKLK